MPVSVIWDNEEQTTIRYIFEGRWTLDELFAVMEQEDQMMTSVEHMVDIIVDFQNSGTVPDHLIANFPKIFESSSASHPNVGITVIVGAAGFAEMLANIFSRVFTRMVTASTLEQAQAIIAKEQANRA
jgi:hypothetical protein